MTKLKTLPKETLSRQDVRSYAIALSLPHLLPPVLLVSKLSHRAIWRCRAIKPHDIFRTAILSSFTTVHETLSAISDVLFEVNSVTLVHNYIWSVSKLDTFWSNILRNWLTVCYIALDCHHHHRNHRHPSFHFHFANGKADTKGYQVPAKCQRIDGMANWHLTSSQAKRIKST
jgi:hypothetical protein